MARTDNDGWDMATGVAATATLVAAARAVATRSRGSDPLRARVWCPTPPGSGRNQHQRVRQPHPLTRYGSSTTLPNTPPSARACSAARPSESG
jgi:hypothetical protein